MHLYLHRMGDSRRTWAALFVLAVSLRLGFAASVPLLATVLEGRQDEMFYSLLATDDYEKIARNLLAGNGYRIRPELGETMLRNPGYVVLLTGAFGVFGQARIVGQVLQAVMAGGVVLLIGKVGRAVVGPGAALIAGLLYTLYPPDWLSSARYAAEPLLTLLLLALMLTLGAFVRRPSPGTGVLVGLIAGAMSLTKSVAVYLLPFLLVWMVVFVPAVRTRLRTVAVPAAAALVVQALLLLPWGAFNAHRSGYWVFSSTIVGWTLFDTQYLNTHPRPGVSPTQRWLEARAEARRLGERDGLRPDPDDAWSFNFFDIRDEYAMGRLLREQAVRSIAADPFSYLGGVFRNAANFWYLGGSRGFTLLGIVINLPLLMLGLYGAIRSGVYRRPEGWIWIGAIVYMNLVTALSFAVARYAVPVMPLLFLLGGAGLTEPARAGGQRARLSSVQRTQEGVVYDV